MAKCTLPGHQYLPSHPPPPGLPPNVPPYASPSSADGVPAQGLIGPAGFLDPTGSGDRGGGSTESDSQDAIVGAVGSRLYLWFDFFMHLEINSVCWFFEELSYQVVSFPSKKMKACFNSGLFETLPKLRETSAKQITTLVFPKINIQSFRLISRILKPHTVVFFDEYFLNPRESIF